MKLTRSITDPPFVVGAVSVGHFISHFYMLSLPPLFPLLLDAFSLTNTQLGLLVSAINLPVLLLQIPVGGLVDRIGAKRVFVAGLLVTATGITLAGLAPGYYALLAFALLSGVGQSAFHPADYALLDAVIDPGSEGKSFSVHTFGGFAGFAAAPVVVGGIGLALGWRPALLLAGVGGFLFALVAWLTMGPVATGRDPESTEGRGPGLREGVAPLLTAPLVAIFLFFAVVFAAGTGIQSFTTIFMYVGEGFPEAVGNTALTGYFVLSSIGILVGGILADRYPIDRLIVGSLAAAGAVVWLLVGGVLTLTVGLAVGLLSTVGFFSGVMRPSRDRLVSRHAPPDSTGRSFGFVFTGGSLGGFLGPVLLGRTIDLSGPATAFVAIGGLFIVAAGIVVAMSVRARVGSDSDPT